MLLYKNLFFCSHCFLTVLIQLPGNLHMQNRFYRFLAEVEIVNYYNKCTYIITVGILQLKLIVSIPPTYKIFQQLFV